MNGASVVRVLTAAQDNDRRAGGARPGTGARMRLHRVAGAWRVWSPGPARGTWWLLADDDDARTVVAELQAGASGEPVVLSTYSTANTYAIAVRTGELCPLVVSGGAA